MLIDYSVKQQLENSQQALKEESENLKKRNANEITISKEELEKKE